MNIKDYDDNCPIDDTLKLISKKWVIFIIRDLFLGKKQFSEFKRDCPNIDFLDLHMKLLN